MLAEHEGSAEGCLCHRVWEMASEPVNVSTLISLIFLKQQGVKVSSILLTHCNMIVKVKQYKIYSTFCQDTVCCTFCLFYVS